LLNHVPFEEEQEELSEEYKKEVDTEVKEKV